jgi:hypothetical protein
MVCVSGCFLTSATISTCCCTESSRKNKHTRQVEKQGAQLAESCLLQHPGTTLPALLACL